MELLAALMAGALGGAVLRGRRMGLIVATGLGILVGGAVSFLLVQFGPGPKAGPLVPVHAVAGLAAGAALVFTVGLVWRRTGG